ncbi:MAG: uroporphyrinogen-III synthase [Puniceicoccales bacterium]|jgi:uroporphyrinogen-III synthase|nr:uroporphyrinogen-III synthase [Puniceicoccales bacterium]
MNPPQLEGKRIVITRPEGNASNALRDALAAYGATVLEIPLLEIEYTADASVLENVWEDMGQFDWLLFTSANGAQGFFDRFFETFNDIRGIGLCRLACIGQSTAATLRNFHLNVELIPDESTSAALARALLAREDIAHLRILLVTGSRDNGSLARTLEEKGHAIVTSLTVYSTTENDASQLDTTESFRRHGADAIIFASPSAVESFVAQAASLTPAKTARHPKVVAIGPTTTASLREHGIPVAAQASSPDPLALAQAVASAISPSIP